MGKASLFRENVIQPKGEKVCQAEKSTTGGQKKSWGAGYPKKNNSRKKSSAKPPWERKKLSNFPK